MKVGVILMDHGEPPVYDKHTYSSFRDFATCLIEMGFIPSIVLSARAQTRLGFQE